MDTLIEIEDLTKHFGSLRAVNGISFTVQRGEVLGFLGPNGAGKSTTMKMVTGFLAPTSGRITIAGHSVLDDPIRAQECLGYLPEGAPLYPDMTPRGLLEFVGAIRGLSGRRLRERIDEVVGKVHLEGVLQQPVETLSKGYKRRVGLALAILHDPEILVLDEPTDGLDPNQKHEVRTLIREMAADKAIVLSTHILEEVEAVCSRAIIIDRGQVVADGTPAELSARATGHNDLRLRVGDAPPTVAADLGSLPEVASVEDLGGGAFRVHPRDRADLAGPVGRLARSKGWELEELTTLGGRLDEVFREVTASDVEEAPPEPPPESPPAPPESTVEREEVTA